MYKYILNIGDWSDDGHGKNEKVILQSSHTKAEIIQAYKDSCKLTWIQFNHNTDYTWLGWDWKTADLRNIATDYEDSKISKENIIILKSHWIDVFSGYEHEDIDEDNFYIDGVENFVEILISFIKLSLLELEAKIIEDKIEWINWYWDFNHQFGYGLFH